MEHEHLHWLAMASALLASIAPKRVGHPAEGMIPSPVVASQPNRD